MCVAWWLLPWPPSAAAAAAAAAAAIAVLCCPLILLFPYCASVPDCGATVVGEVRKIFVSFSLGSLNDVDVL